MIALRLELLSVEPCELLPEIDVVDVVIVLDMDELVREELLQSLFATRSHAHEDEWISFPLGDLHKFLDGRRPRVVVTTEGTEVDRVVSPW